MSETTTSYQVIGMTCQHCVQSVNEEISSIEGVRQVEVDLVPEGESTVWVTTISEVPDEQIYAAVDEAGYEVAR